MKNLKKVLILGASSDIGLATVNYYLKNNWHVFGHYNKNNFKSKNKNLDLFKLDFLASSKIIDNKIKILKKIKFDAIINLVGFIDNKSLSNFKIKDLERSLRVNSIVPIYIIKKLVPSMVRHKFGRILQTSSIGVKFGGGKNTFNYSISKKTNEFIPRDNKIWSSKNVLMNTLVIGVTDTKIHKKISNKNVKLRKKLIPMKRFATTSEIAKYIYFLASEKNTFISGQVLSISGGE